MFSFIVTLISIGLAVALAAVTVSYGGRALNQSKARADAITISEQGHQILAAAQMFHAEVGRWPNDVSELVTANDLQVVPQPVGGSWAPTQAGAAYFWLHAAVPEERCRWFNYAMRKDDGIYRAAKPSLSAQCFGNGPPYTLVMDNGSAGDTPTLSDVITAADSSLQVDESGNGYVVTPQLGAGG